jgi:hypothetical protein
MPAGDADTRPVTRGRRPLAVVAAVAVVLLLAAVLVWWLGRGPTGPYAEALDTLGEDTLRSSFTDWSRVDQEVGVPSVEEAREADTVADFLDRAYDADLVTGSAQLDVIRGLALTYGYSPAQAEWEAYGQSRAGAVNVLKMTDEVDFEEVARNLEQAGYDQPSEDDGVWRGSGDLVVEFESPMTTLQKNVLLLAEERLVLTSDSAGYLEETVTVIHGDEPSLRDVAGVDALLEAASDAASAQLWAGDFACEDLSMTQADSVDQEQAARLVEQAGGVHPLDGLVMARTGDDDVTVALYFDSESDADDDLQPRTDLARGPAPGQGGEFSDRFTVEDSRVEGKLVTMRLRAVTDTVMGDLGQGPVLYATC